MCLAIPGRVITIAPEHDLLFGQVVFDGTPKRVCLDLIPEVRVGDYVLVYAGYALTIVDEAEAQRVLDLLAEMNELGDLLEVPE